MSHLAFDIVSVGEIASEESGAIAIGPFGSAMKANLYVDVGVPVVRGNNIGNGRNLVGSFVYVAQETALRLKRSLLKANDIVFPHRGAIGEVGIIREGVFKDILMSSSLMRLRVNIEFACPEFVFWFFKSAIGRQEILTYASTVGTPGIGQPLTSLRSMMLPLPPLPEQREIAAILGALDDKIEVNRKASATLEAMARALYRSWFVDFDPVWAKLEGRPPAHMPPETAALFPDSFDDEGLPMGWRFGTLADVAKLNPETHSKKAHPSHLEYVDLANTKWGVIEATTIYEWEAAPSRARMALRHGDSIIGTVRPGNGSYSYIGRDGLTGSTGFAVLRPSGPENAALIYLAATDPDTIDDLANLADGGAYPAVRPDVVAARPIVLASAQIQTAFAQITSSLILRMEAMKTENQTLAALRDSLLPRLMSGELRVGEARAQVEELI